MPRDLKPHKVREMTPDEIRLQIEEKLESLFNLRFRNTMKQLDNPLEIRNVRRDIAILRTILREHQLGVRKLGAAGQVSKPEGDR
jgi:large subunit ribosomal protein L29